jgi:hypothetical protein
MKHGFLLFFIALAVSFCALTTAASAQATRTWVSGTGDDANPCSRTAPCKTFAGAISKTTAGGEIDALDPAGYGTLTITKAITIDGGGGVVASVLAAGTVGFTVNAGPNDVVILRNLMINGIAQSTSPGTNGINVVAGGFLILEHDYIQSFNNSCVNMQPASSVGLYVHDTAFDTCGSSGGLVISTTTGTEHAVVSNSHFSKSVGPGVTVGQGAKLTITDSDISNNQGGGLTAGGTNAFVELQHDMIANNGAYGVRTTTGGTAYLSFCSILFNTNTGIDTSQGGTISTWSNNFVIGNNPDGGPNGAAITPK